MLSADSWPVPLHVPILKILCVLGENILTWLDCRFCYTCNVKQRGYQGEMLKFGGNWIQIDRVISVPTILKFRTNCNINCKTPCINKCTRFKKQMNPQTTLRKLAQQRKPFRSDTVTRIKADARYIFIIHVKHSG